MKKNKRARSRKGFTLAETLLAVLILLMVSSIVATGVPAAKNAYEKVVLGANAQILLSTSLTALRDELGTASDIKKKGNTLSYYSAKTHSYARIFCDSESKGIMVRDYIGYEDKDKEPVPEEATAETARRLVSEKAATKDLYVTYKDVDVTYKEVGDSEGMVTFSNIEVRRTAGNSVVASLDTFYIRTV